MHHGPFGQNSMVPNGPWRYGLSLARGSQARHARAAGGSGGSAVAGCLLAGFADQFRRRPREAGPRTGLAA
jgi:hypothetical protein